MLDSLYNKSVVCPVCQNKIEVTKVKSKDCVVASRDSDFCVYYESVNPLFMRYGFVSTVVMLRSRKGSRTFRR